MMPKKFKKFDITVLSIESEENFSDVPCGSCTQCCEKLSPYLTPEEFLSGKYIYSLISTDDPSIPVIAIPRNEKGCLYFVDNKCSIYNDRPKSCRQFDCRKGHYPPFKDLVKEKFEIDI